ncbi:MAG: hypothetical protein R6W97_00845 [Thiobacillus sp.]
MLGLVAVVATVLAGANSTWQVVDDMPERVISIDLSSLQRSGGHVSFQERHVIRGEQLNLNSLRPMREILLKRVIDCRDFRMATLSRAVFSDGDALIEYRAMRPGQAVWPLMAKADPLS